MRDLKLNHRLISLYKNIGLQLTFLLFFAIGGILHCGSNAISQKREYTANLTTPSETTNVSSLIQYRITGPRAGLKDILTRTDDWKRNLRENFEQSFSSNIFWFKIPLKNGTNQSVWYATLNNSRLNYVDFYLVTKNNTQVYKTGDYRRLPENAVSAFPAFRFNLSSEEEATLYVRIKTNTNISFSLNIAGSEAFGELISKRLLIHVLYGSILFLYLLFQVRFNPAVKGIMEFHLSGTMIMALLYFFCFFGEANRLLWPNSIYLKNTMIFVFNIIGQLFFLQFLPLYLKIPEIAPRLNRLFRLQTIIVALLIPGTLLIESNYVRTLIVAIPAILMFILMLSGIVIALRKRYYWVLFLAVSWILFTGAAIIFASTFFGLVPYNYFTANIVLLLFPMDAIALTISLIYRHRSLAQDRDRLRANVDVLLQNLATKETHTSSKKDVEITKVPLNKNPNRRIQSLDSVHVLEELTFYFKRERPYLVENLNLTMVAGKLKIRPDQLSAILNTHMNTSFTVLVNEYRIRAACRLMQEKPNFNLLNIAFECGFGSRTSFNRVFKQNMEMAPAEYRRRLPRPILKETPV